MQKVPRRTWILIGVGVLVLILSAIILLKVGGPLYSLLFLDLPIPDGAHEVDHIKPEHGAEYWIYRTNQSGIDVAEFYENEGGSCRYTSSQESAIPDTSYSVAQCTGKTENADVGFSWEVYIATGYSDDEGPTIFRIYKYGN
jgi:hypothetical protein